MLFGISRRLEIALTSANDDNIVRVIHDSYWMAVTPMADGCLVRY
jgi:hypothetical protein